jgi:tetratricopeptide (TPR) repeat protein
MQIIRNSLDLVGDVNAEAEVLYQRALRIREEQLGQEHSDVALSLKGLANLYTRQGKYTQAEQLYLRALRIVEQQLGPEHAETANILHDFAGLQQTQGQTQETAR